jgi:predicted DNA-binding antitoxin AbrB/MazE fold protein
MTHDIDAIYSDGVFRPIEPLALPDGARVHLRVESDDTKSIGSFNGTSNYGAWLDRLAGRWLGDEFERGDEGDFETRESIS